MNYGFFDVLELVGSLGFFLFGMKLMSESLQKVAGDKMRSILSAMTSNRLKGIFTGFLITAIIQSSSATTVMIVSFVNAGLLSLIESIGVIMGANIGTTVTAWLISILGFKVKMSALAIPLIGLGFPLLFSKRSKSKAWGELVVGFAIIFIGLDFLKAAVPDLKSNPDILAFLGDYTGMGLPSTLLFLLVGTILTVVIQSSSATMALTLVLCHQGLITFEMAAAMVLGENIGTTITANLAAMVTNSSARRAARAHLIFNVFGVLWVLILYSPFLLFIEWLVMEMGFASPIDTIGSVPIALSMFHTCFNIANVLILAWFAPLIARIVCKMIVEKEEDEEFRLKYINVGTLSTSELSLLQARNEIAVFSERVTKMFSFVRELFNEKKEKNFEKTFSRIEKYEDISDRMEVEIATYLTKVAEGELSQSGTVRLKTMLKIITDLESVSDSCYNIAKAINRKKEQKAVFIEEMNENVEKMFNMVEKAINLMQKNLSGDYHVVESNEAARMERQINKYRDKLKQEHVVNIKEGIYKYKEGSIYNDIFSENEKLADYVINVSEALDEVKE